MILSFFVIFTPLYYDKLYNKQTNINGGVFKPETINAISLSSSNKYLVLKAGYISGNKLFVIDLKDGSYNNINDLVKSPNAVETVSAFAWSSNGQKIAFSYGDPSVSRIAIYNVFYGTFTYVPRETSTISTAFILWDKKGDFIDYASEYPSDNFKLYRYSLNTKKTKIIKALDSTEITKMSQISN